MYSVILASAILTSRTDVCDVRLDILSAVLRSQLANLSPHLTGVGERESRPLLSQEPNQREHLGSRRLVERIEKVPDWAAFSFPFVEFNLPWWCRLDQGEYTSYGK